jgi:serpin B
MDDAQELAAQAHAAVAAQNAFGLTLLSRVAAERRHENVFVSPSSVFLALSMAALGAAGRTHAAICQTLQLLAHADDDAWRASAAALSRSLRLPRAGIDLAIASALWSDRTAPLAADCVARCRALYDAEAVTLDFRDPRAADEINHWVRRATRDRIDGIVSARTLAASKAILTNAVYCKGLWRHTFAEDLTRDAPFHLANGTRRRVPMMRQPTLLHAYRDGPGYQAAVLPYGPAAPRPAMALCAILPAPGVDPEEALTRLPLAAVLDDEQPVQCDLRLPELSLDFDGSLKRALARMGMAIAFEYPHADFAPMGSPSFYIGDVLHRTRLEVDEEGTVAAAVTAIIAPTGLAHPPTPVRKTLVFDRPFALLLCDRWTGAIVFAGVVYDPGGTTVPRR